MVSNKMKFKLVENINESRADLGDPHYESKQRSARFRQLYETELERIATEEHPISWMDWDNLYRKYKAFGGEKEFTFPEKFRMRYRSTK